MGLARAHSLSRARATAAPFRGEKRPGAERANVASSGERPRRIARGKDGSERGARGAISTGRAMGRGKAGAACRRARGRTAGRTGRTGRTGRSVAWESAQGPRQGRTHGKGKGMGRAEGSASYGAAQDTRQRNEQGTEQGAEGTGLAQAKGPGRSGGPPGAGRGTSGGNAHAAAVSFLERSTSAASAARTAGLLRLADDLAPSTNARKTSSGVLLWDARALARS